MAKKTVILADDNKTVLAALSDLLRESGYEVEEASSFTAAKKLIEKGGQDLAVLDLHLKPGDRKDDLSGLELANKAYDRDVMPVIITGDKAGAALARKHQPVDAFPVDIVQKGDNPKPLLKALRRAESMLESIRPAVFLAHGRDKKTRQEVADFLNNGKMQVVVLQDLASGGSQPILQKLETYSNVQFGVVLVTPDDIGCLRKKPYKLRHRARQNVIFELGYLIGKLGPSRVVALFKEEGEEIERPSNYGGVLFLEMDADSEWQDKLALEIQNALTLVRRS